MSMGVAYGLAIQGTGAGRINNSLLPPEIARTMVWRRKTPWFGAAAAVLLIGGLTVGYSRARFASAVEACNTGGFNTSVSDVSDGPGRHPDRRGRRPDGPGQGGEDPQCRQPAARASITTVTSSRTPAGELLKSIAELYKNRTFWIDLMERIHATLPQPSPELAAAKTSADYMAALKKIPRNQRKMVYIDEMQTGYVTDTAAGLCRRQHSAPPRAISRGAWVARWTHPAAVAAAVWRRRPRGGPKGFI